MTQLALFNLYHTLQPLEKMVQLAAFLADHVRVQEEPHGSNKGYWVTAFLKEAGIDTPSPWCASFVTALAKHVGIMPKIDGPAAVVNWSRWAEDNGKIVATPKRGDLFFLLHVNGTGHIGIVVENKGQSVRTVEGNSNDEGDREGYEVCRLERKLAGLRFIRL